MFVQSKPTAFRRFGSGCIGCADRVGFAGLNRRFLYAAELFDVPVSDHPIGDSEFVDHSNGLVFVDAGVGPDVCDLRSVAGLHDVVGPDPCQPPDR